MSISLPQLPSIPTLSDYTAARDSLFEMFTKISNEAVASRDLPSFALASSLPSLPLSPHNGGTGGMAMTEGSVVFVGPAGVYYQENSNFFWDSFYGRLGLGTNVPGGTLHVASTVGLDGLVLFSSCNNSAVGLHLTFQKSRQSPGVVTTADELGAIRFDGYSGAAGYVTTAAIKAFASGTVATTRVPGYLSFWTGTDAAPTVLTERMRIQNDGKVGVGTPTPGTLLDVTGTVTATLFSGPLTGNVTGTVTGNVTGNAGGTAGSLSTVYRMRAYNSVATSLVNATSTQVTLGTELEDPNNNFATSAYTVPVTGWYIVTGSVSTGQASGILYASLYDSTSSVVILRSPFSASVAAGIGSTASFGGAVYLTAAHVLVVYGYQNSGGAVNTQTGAEGTFLNVHFLGA